MKKMVRSVLLLSLSLIILNGCKKEMYEPAYGICTKVSDYPMVSAAGYDFIEENVSRFLAPDKPDSVFMQNLEEQRTTGTKIISCVSFIPGKLKAVGDSIKHEEILSWGDTAFRRAQMAGITYIVFGSGGARKVPDGFPKEQATRQFIDLCKKLAPIAAKYNIIIVIEPLNSGETNLINTMAEGAHIVEAVNHPNLQLLCDIYHMMRENETPEEIIKYGKYIRHCHIAEKEERSAPGVKNDNFIPYFQALKQIGYNGALSIECRWQNMSEQALPALVYLKQQFKSLQ